MIPVIRLKIGDNLTTPAIRLITENQLMIPVIRPGGCRGFRVQDSSAEQIWHMLRQSRPDSGLGFLVHILHTIDGVPSALVPLGRGPLWATSNVT